MFYDFEADKYTCNHHNHLPDYFIQKLSPSTVLIPVAFSFVFMQNVNTQSGEPKKKTFS